MTALVLSERRQRYLLVGWFWFLGTMLPMIGLVQVGEQAMADRYAYLPFIGLFIMICWGVADWAEQRSVSAACAGRRRRGGAGGAERGELIVRLATGATM